MRPENRLIRPTVLADARAVGLIQTWPSLADQLALAEQLFGTSGQRKVAEWVDEQAGLVGDTQFARTFSDHIDLPGVAPLDYAHRHIHTTDGDVLGGIRFYSRNTARPFVEVMAHSFDDIDALAGCVFAEWSNFNVRFLRIRTRPHLLAGRDDVLLDESIHLARCHEMAPSDGRVTLEKFVSAEQAIRLVTARYAEIVDTDPALSNNLCPAAPEDLRRWHDHDQLWAVHHHGAVVGAFAVAPGAIGWITGQEINEEVITEAHAGHGYAASAQCAWAHGRAGDMELLIGTIDRHNQASRATALRAGRPRVLDDVFIARAQSSPNGIRHVIENDRPTR